MLRSTALKGPDQPASISLFQDMAVDFVLVSCKPGRMLIWCWISSVHGVLDPITLGRSLEEIRYKHRVVEPRQFRIDRSSRSFSPFSILSGPISVVMIRATSAPTDSLGYCSCRLVINTFARAHHFLHVFVTGRKFVITFVTICRTDCFDQVLVIGFGLSSAGFRELFTNCRHITAE